MITPAFDNHNAIVLAADNNYCPYLAVTIKSLIENASPQSDYDIVILSSGIAKTKQQQIAQMQNPHVSIRFVDMEEYMKGLDLSKFYVSGHITISSYFRIFIPDIFQDYRKVAYLDCDIVVLTDINRIFEYDLEDNIVGVVHDIDNYVYPDNRLAYMRDKLHIDYKNYFNAGILVMDITKARQQHFIECCFDLLERLQAPMFHDQTLLNGVCYKKAKFLDMGWNYQTHFNAFHSAEELNPECPDDYLKEYNQKRDQAHILHYTAKPKPWENPKLDLAEKWWEYARKTNFYEEILFTNFQSNYNILLDVFRYPSYRRRYVFYKVATVLTFGKLKKDLKQKRREMKANIRKVRQFLKTQAPVA